MAERYRLLFVVEDDVERAAIRRAIDQSAIESTVVEATDATDARVKLAAGGFDCVLVDQDLSGSSGVELARQMRAAGDLVPIVFTTTASRGEALLEEAVDVGVTDFVLKDDLSPRRLALRIRVAVRVGRAEAALARSLEQATAAARARDDVLAIVSHDLRGPLHAIGLACDALRDEVSEAPARYFGMIERAASRAERLIADLLEASAIENGALTLVCTSQDAGALVRQAAADQELLANETGVKISTQIPTEPITVSADRERILQVFANLIGNALKHAKGTPIELSVERRGHDVVFAVRDRGPGISATELPHVFDRYWSGRTKKGGAGLGLSIAKGIVDAHRGVITVDSAPGDGACFRFTLHGA